MSIDTTRSMEEKCIYINANDVTVDLGLMKEDTTHNGAYLTTNLNAFTERTQKGSSVENYIASRQFCIFKWWFFFFRAHRFGVLLLAFFIYPLTANSTNPTSPTIYVNTQLRTRNEMLHQHFCIQIFALFLPLSFFTRWLRTARNQVSARCVDYYSIPLHLFKLN